MKGLIVAAGQGTRLRNVAPSKPLAVVRGKPLIERVIESAHQAGLSEFVVVTGYEASRIEAFLRRLSMRLGLKIATVYNPDWRLPNGHSVVAAAPHLDERFVLMMADHLFDPSLLTTLLAAPAVDGEALLAVDRRLDNPLVDLEDVTRVETDANGRITNIGKLIDRYDAFDTGLFSVSTSLIDALREDIAEGGNGGISAGMLKLAARGLAGTVDIGARFWLDVDDATAHGQAERLDNTGRLAVGA